MLVAVQAVMVACDDVDDGDSRWRGRDIFYVARSSHCSDRVAKSSADACCSGRREIFKEYVLFFI